jgi:PAS domain S-box-containing protein
MSSAAQVSTSRRDQIGRPIVRIAVCIGAVFVAVAIVLIVNVPDRPLAVALNLFLIVVLFAAIRWGTRYAVFVSLLSAFAFSWSLPPVGHFHSDDGRVWTLLAACLVTGLIAGQLSRRVRRAVLDANQRRAEAVAEQQRFADLVNSVEGIVWEANAETFAFSFVSEQAERILGYPAGEWLSVPTFWKDHLHPEDRGWAVRLCQEATAQKRSHDLEYRMIASDGRVVWIRDLITVVVENGRATRLRGVMVDITERKRAEEEREKLRQLEADLAHINRVTMMGELAASLGHEIKQPLSAAITNANVCLRWLKRDHPDLQEAQEAATRMIQDAMRSAEIINRTSSFYKKGISQRELVEINEVVDEIVVLLHNQAKRSGVSIRTELGVGLPKVLADRVQLQQVIMNLVINSIDATQAIDSIREITLRSQADGSDRVLVSVSDTGVGLPPEMSQIFDAFFTTKPHGTGMGLAISRTIIESHGGRLWASSNSGSGAVFHFTLPAAVEAQAA